MFEGRLTYDLADLMRLKNKVKNSYQELDSLSKKTKKNVDKLRKDWKTPAGEKFFEEFDNNWENDVKKYKKALTVLEIVLQDTINDYEQVSLMAKVTLG